MKLRWNWKRWPFAIVALLLGGAPALAHEKWFVDARATPAGPSIFSLVNPAFAASVIACAAALFVLLAWLDRRLDGSPVMRWFDTKIRTFEADPRVVLGVSLGVSLMGAGLQKTLFSPSLTLPDTALGTGLAFAQLVLGTMLLFLEAFYAELGLLTIAVFLLGFSVEPFWDLMEEFILVGAGIYLAASETARKPWSVWNTPERRRLGYQALRVVAGVSFLVLSTVKWLRPELGLEVVQEHHLNFVRWIGVSDIQFVFFAAVVETFVAACILLRVAFRPAVAVAFAFFLLTVYFLGFRELLGHLPIKAVLFLLFIYGHWHKGETRA